MVLCRIRTVRDTYRKGDWVSFMNINSGCLLVGNSERNLLGDFNGFWMNGIIEW